MTRRCRSSRPREGTGCLASDRHRWRSRSATQRPPTALSCLRRTAASQRATAKSICSMSTLASGEAYRESSTVAGGGEAVRGRTRIGARSASPSAMTCAFPSSIAGWPRKALSSSPCRRLSPCRPAKRALACAAAGPRHREWRLCRLPRRRAALHANGRKTYGHSLIVAPWGEVLAEAGTEPGVIVADIDPALSAEARARLPNLQHDRHFTGP